MGIFFHGLWMFSIGLLICIRKIYNLDEETRREKNQDTCRARKQRRGQLLYALWGRLRPQRHRYGLQRSENQVAGSQVMLASLGTRGDVPRNLIMAWCVEWWWFNNSLGGSGAPESVSVKGGLCPRCWGGGERWRLAAWLRASIPPSWKKQWKYLVISEHFETFCH